MMCPTILPFTCYLIKKKTIKKKLKQNNSINLNVYTIIATDLLT